MGNGTRRGRSGGRRSAKTTTESGFTRRNPAKQSVQYRLSPRGRVGTLDPSPSEPYTHKSMAFRDRLLATIEGARPVLEEPDVLVVGSQVPNLLQIGAAATLVVSQDLDIGVPVSRHAAVKRRLGELLISFQPSPEEPSVWTPRSSDLLEVNFVGIDPSRDPADAYVFEDDQLPLLVFGALSLVTAGAEIEFAGTRVRVPRPAGLVLEKLVTDRAGEKGDRDLLVALGLLMAAGPADLDELDALYARLRPELRHAVRSNLTILSLIDPRIGMPDPLPQRSSVAALLRRLEAVGGGAP